MPKRTQRTRQAPFPGDLRRRKRADARRLDILRAAARVFRERGFAAAGMREIADAAELSPANLYHYFRGKNEILFFCQNQSLERVQAELASIRRRRGPIATRLRALATAHVLCLIDEVFGSSAHFEVEALPAAERAAIIAKRDTYERGVRNLVAAAMRRGELRSTDATVATRAFLGALNWTAQWFRPEGPDTARHVAELVSEFAVAGLVHGAEAPVTNSECRIKNAERRGSRRGSEHPF
jgi:AcrR family transcriptional regulator